MWGPIGVVIEILRVKYVRAHDPDAAYTLIQDKSARMPYLRSVAENCHIILHIGHSDDNVTFTQQILVEVFAITSWHENGRTIFLEASSATDISHSENLDGVDGRDNVVRAFKCEAV